MSGTHLSKGFFELVKSIGESKSKEEEDRIISSEVVVLKRKIQEPGVTRAKMKEFLIRMIYVEMLGQDASFGYIKAIELTASQNILQKKAGYLCCTLTLAPDHEFRFMLVNQMQRDLSSSNHLEACAALTALSHLVTEDMIPAVLSHVVKLLKHDKELVRKKAVMVLQRLYQLEPESVGHMGDMIRRTLCDKDPSVMAASLCLLSDLVATNPEPYKDLVPSFVSILKQVIEHRLPREYDYHRMPAPWTQMRLLRLLAMLGKADRAASEGMYQVLHEVMKRADNGINVGYAVIYECIRTITSIFPNTTLLDAAAASISRFIASDNHNLKCAGVIALASIVPDYPSYASQHQMVVIDCLEDPDETLRRKTLGLLYCMTNPVNVEFITDKLLTSLAAGGDSFWRADLVTRITQCAERFAPSNSWYVEVMTRVFELAAEHVGADVAKNLMQLVAEGSGEEKEEEEADMEMRRDAVDVYVDLINKSGLHHQLIQIASWILGEYGYLAEGIEQEELVEHMCNLFFSGNSLKESATKGYVVSAVVKASAQMGVVVDAAKELLDLYADSVDADLQQRCREFQRLTSMPSLMAAVLPVNASCEDIDIDESLPFLDDYVEAKLEAGAAPYSPPEQDDSDEEEERNGKKAFAGGFKHAPYARPDKVALTPAAPGAAGATTAMPAPGLEGAVVGSPSVEPFSMPAKLKAAPQIWGKPSAARKQAQQTRATSTTATPASSSGATPATSADTGTSNTGASKKPKQRGGTDPAASEQKTAQQQEKERMAAMLFSGVGGSSSSGVAGRSRAGHETRRAGAKFGRKSRSPKAVSPAADQGLSSSGAFDLLDMSEGSPPAPVTGANGTTAAAAAAKSGAGADLFDLIADPSPLSTPQPAPAPAPAPAPELTAATSDPFLDLMGPETSEGPSSSNGAAAAVSVGIDATGPSMTGGDDLMNMGSLLDAGPNASATTGGGGAMNALGAMPASLHSTLSLGGSPAIPMAPPPIFSFNGMGMKPLSITTASFGGKWMQCTQEQKLNAVRTSLSTPHQVMTLLQRDLDVHPVEVIGATFEGICAGEVGSEGCLLHCKLWPDRKVTDITVRSGRSDLTAAVAAYIRGLMQRDT